jgi:hypothetical protein
VRVFSRLLLGAAAVVLVAILLAGGSRVRRLPSVARVAIDVIFVFAVVRLSLGLALIAFGDTWVVIAIAVVLGLLAWRFRPSAI